MTTLWASSGYGMNTRQPFVTIHWKDVTVQMSPEEARAFASTVVGAAEASEQDAFLVEWVQSQIGCDMIGAANLLMEFRQWREQRMKNLEGS